MKSIRLLLLDDHASFRLALTMVLEGKPDIDVIAQAGTLAEARRKLGELGDAVDLALLDLDLPDGLGTDLIADLRAFNPQSLAIILSSFYRRGDVARAVEAGAAGFLNKSADLDEILDAVRRLHSGGQLIPPAEALEMVRFAIRTRETDRDARLALERITARELDVLQSLADGLNDKEMAQRLRVGPGTVRSHLTNILQKLGVESRLQALLFALRHGAVTLEGTHDERPNHPPRRAP